MVNGTFNFMAPALFSRRQPSQQLTAMRPPLHTRRHSDQPRTHRRPPSPAPSFIMSTSLEKCTNSLLEIHRLLRESSTTSTSEYGTISNSTSMESSPVEQATSRSARRKWHSAIRVIQGLNRFRQPVHRERHDDNDSSTNSQIDNVDPVYLALKQATRRLSQRTSNLDSVSPSPRNLSQASLQDSGYVEIVGGGGMQMLGSTPQLDNAGRSLGQRRAPKLSQQMKSLSLDCQDVSSRSSKMCSRSPLRSRLAVHSAANGSSSDFSDSERSCSPMGKRRQNSSATIHHNAGFVVIHDYTPSNGSPLILGEKVIIVDNGDPDWLHGFRYNDRTEQLLTFPATCVTQMFDGEQPMRISQNVIVPEQKLRMYRDQIVFVQPDSLVDGKVIVRTEHNAFARCPLTSLALL